MKTGIGVSEYQLTRALSKEFQSSLPSVRELEAALRDAPQEDAEQ